MNKYMLSAVLSLCLASLFSNVASSNPKPAGEVKSLFELLGDLESEEELQKSIQTYLNFLQSAKSGDFNAVKNYLVHIGTNRGTDRPK